MNFNDMLSNVLKNATGNKQDEFDVGGMLNSVLGAVKTSGGQSKSDMGELLNSVLGAAKNTLGQVKSGDTSSITKMGGGAALVGMLSMILGRNGGANLTKLGSLAALGSLAYQAYQHYQQNQLNQQNQTAGATALTESAFTQLDHSGEQSSLLLRAMIAAAMADGELDDRETQLLEQESADNPQAKQILMAEIAQPMTPVEIAAAVNGDEALASQVYLASRLICAELSRKEVIYLATLAEALALDEALVVQLDKQAGF